MERNGATEEWLKGHAPMESGASLADGSLVGRWRIAAFVARGGSGEVYRAVEADGGRTAALKILHRTDSAARERFTREAQVLSELRDRAFPVFFESGAFDGRPWYATEFLQPLDLPATDRAVARFVVAVCRGAGALHALGYVHRDIKPANILFRDDEPVLIDLGLLKKAETPALHTGGTVSVVDGRPVGVGTPGYAAPEQFMGGEISPTADIHAIGVLASTCFGGRPPRAWRGIIRRATSSLPAERYPDVASLARAVRCRHLPAALGAIAAIAAGAVLVTVAAIWPGGARQPLREQVVGEHAPTPSTGPAASRAPALAEAYSSTADRYFGSDWARGYNDILDLVETAAKTPESIPDLLVQRLVLEPHNEICNIDHGAVAFQISSYNKRYPRRAKRMPQPSDFAPLLSDMLRRRNAGGPLGPEEYLAFRRRFFDIVGMSLHSAFNRLVVEIFPEQFVTPVDDPHLAKCQEALTARHFISPMQPRKAETAWFERSSHMARELRAGLSGDPRFDAATLSRFVWVVGMEDGVTAGPAQEPDQPEPAPQPKAEPAPVPTPTPNVLKPNAQKTMGAPVPGSAMAASGPEEDAAVTTSEGDMPIVASERIRQKLADQGATLPSVTPNQIRKALKELEGGMVPIPGRDVEICKFELPQSVWEPIAGFNPSKEKGPDLPVSNVTMADVEEFLEGLNDLPEVRASGRTFRLPTAEEWEFACLAGGTNGFCRLADGTQITAETLGEVAWFAGNSANRPHPVCTKKPNAFGLYDMHGNVAEFTSTRKPDDLFEYIWKGNAYNGKNPESFRAGFSPSITYGLSFHIAGFRLAR